MMIAEGTYENPTISMEETPKFNRLFESVVVAIIETELVVLKEELDKYHNYVTDHMLALDDGAFSQTRHEILLNF